MIKITTNILFITMAFLMSTAVQAQEFDALLKKVTNKYLDTPQYQSKLVYTIYKDSISKAQIESSTGEVIKQHTNTYIKIKDTEIIQGSGFTLKISHHEKMALVSYTTSHQNIEQTLSPFLQFTSKFSLKKVIDKGTFWECVMQQKNHENALPYEKIVFHVDKENFNLLEQKYFFNTSLQKRFIPNTKDQENERLEIVQTTFDSQKPVPEKLFVLENYLQQKNNALVGINSIKGYKLIIQ